MNFLSTAPRQRETPLFDGYAPENPQPGKPFVIARLAAQTPEAYSCVLHEDYVPVVCFSATATPADLGTLTVLHFSTGTGEEVGLLLHQLCQALASGEASLQVWEDATGTWRKTRVLLLHEDGRQVTLRRQGVHLAWLEIASRRGLDGKTIPGMDLYLRNLNLAARLATAIAENGLDFEYEIRPVHA